MEVEAFRKMLATCYQTTQSHPRRLDLQDLGGGGDGFGPEIKRFITYA
jgi:hypothetical protein